jgi:hypothetical protein
MKVSIRGSPERVCSRSVRICRSSSRLVDVADVNADVELSTELAGAAFGVVEKLDEVFVGFALIAFGDVGGDG